MNIKWQYHMIGEDGSRQLIDSLAALKGDQKKAEYIQRQATKLLLDERILTFHLN